jgi:hypothetical protein
VTHVDVTVDDFPFVRLGNYNAVYRSGCVGHDKVWVMYCVLVFWCLKNGAWDEECCSQILLGLLHHRSSVRSAEYMLTNKRSRNRRWRPSSCSSLMVRVPVGMLRLCCRHRVAEP